jgi:hypothetical protein
MAAIAEKLYDWIRIANEARERLDLPVGTIEEAIATLEKDYRAMRDMFYREPPTLEAIMAGLASLEQEINVAK